MPLIARANRISGRSLRRSRMAVSLASIGKQGRRIQHLLLLASCFAAMSCGSRAAGRGSTAGVDAITAEEIETAGPATVYEAVQRLRPSWLFRLGGVFLDDTRHEVADLRTMSMVRVRRIELVPASEATARWNTRSISEPFLHVIRR